MEINQEETRIDYSEKNPNDEAGLERETRFELATPTLARLCSTTELFPQKPPILNLAGLLSNLPF